MNATRKGSMSINEYVMKMKGFSKDLAAAGQLLSTNDVVSSVLGGLGHEYDPVVVTITAKQSYISLQEVLEVLKIKDLEEGLEEEVEAEMVVEEDQGSLSIV
ncbi:hypothetical protein ACOSQ2_017261 [Xanthoceras sorbifolium]